MKELVCGILLCLALVHHVPTLCSANPINATYDQRQNGKVNVHISIKDVAIILQGASDLVGGGEDDINYDYDYDYDHLTVKPNGIWATGGANIGTSAAPVNPAPTTAPFWPTNPPPSPMTPENNELPAEATANATTHEETPQDDQTASFVPYPIPADYNSPQPSLALETLSESSHPYVDSAASPASSESPIINIVPSWKPGNRTTNKYAWNGDLEEIPVEVIIEPVLKNKQRQHVMPGAGRSRPTRKYGRHNGKPGNKFGMEQLIKLLSVLDKGDDKDYNAQKGE